MVGPVQLCMYNAILGVSTPGNWSLPYAQWRAQCPLDDRAYRRLQVRARRGRVALNNLVAMGELLGIQV